MIEAHRQLLTYQTQDQTSQGCLYHGLLQYIPASGLFGGPYKDLIFPP